MGVKKQYLKTGNVCNVTFRLPQEAASDATVVTVVGEFNNWDLSDTPMKKLKNGSFTATLKLPCGNEYRFRYLIDSSRWENDWSADEYKQNAFGGEDSVIRI
ncbi:MAG TPA: glycoside hydrolase [Nitrospirae bacterium]|nr:glycoside hydrolase [Nitrospirota bacterium]HDO66951.1 glycoside hydrolase [Nitrospirota bacterium]HEW81125.1 glycoside hydrolase [Nitrospirota bacterium]